MNEFQKFEVSQVGILIRENKCLILEFSKSPGKWGLPGGRIDKGETEKDIAFKRELKEEIGFDRYISHCILDYDLFFVRPGKTICGIVQYIENTTDEIVLSHEHLGYKWISEDELNNYTYYWHALPRMIKKGFEYHRKVKK